MGMNLYDVFSTMPSERWKYYNDTLPIDFKSLSKKDAYRFIRGTYTLGEKEKIFDIGFHDKFQANGKHQHTVALYFLGCYLVDIISDTYNGHLKQFVDNIDRIDFNYIWYLTCLYHDTASVIEASKYTCKYPNDLNFYLGKFNILHDVYAHVWKKGKPHSYSEKLVKNYFTYRAEYGHIDHGIIAGYLIYDRLRKNYDVNWTQFQLEHPNGDYECFFYKNLCWKIQHHSLFAYVANAIIAHNIWYSKNTPESKLIYQKYGLDPLIYNKSSRLSIKKDPFVFFFGLLDTIEPIKFFCSKNTNRPLNVKAVWEAIEIHYDTHTHKLQIITDKTLSNRNSWFQKIKGMQGWLNVEVKDTGASEITITINK